MAANRLKGETDDQLVKRNLREIEEERIPAFTNSFNKARLRHKKRNFKASSRFRPI
jgi:hypothetical protein